MQNIRLKVSKQLGNVHVQHTEHANVSAGNFESSAEELERRQLQALEIVQSLNEEMTTRLQEYEDRRQKMIGEFQALSIEVAFAALAKILRQQIDEDKFPVESIVKQMTQQVVETNSVQILLNPEDIKLLDELSRQVESDQSNQETAHSITIIPDSSIARGGCQMESNDIVRVRDLRLMVAEMFQSSMEELDEPAIERRERESANRQLQRFPDRRSAS